jgi:hypothetical protein
MKTKIIGIFVCMLLIATAIPIVSSLELQYEMKSRSVVDQEQPKHGEVHWMLPTVANWQEFVNLGDTLEMVELHVGCGYGGSPDITLSIEETVGGAPLTHVTYVATDLPQNTQDWFQFDFPDVNLKRNGVYYMVIRFDPGSEYAWSGEHGDPYPSGASSHPDADWDYAFRTIVDKSKRVNTPLFNFLENHPNILPILRYILGL